MSVIDLLSLKVQVGIKDISGQMKPRLPLGDRAALFDKDDESIGMLRR